jgi:hypothetical protein
MKTKLMVALVTLLAAAGCSTAEVSPYEFPVVIGRASAPGARDTRAPDRRHEHGVDRNSRALME